MSETEHDNEAKLASAQPEELMKLVRAFLTIENPKLRADIIAMIKQKALVQSKM